MVSLIKVVVGILVIGALYTVPFVHNFGDAYTLSTVAAYCQGKVPSVLGESECNAYQAYFYLGWIIGIVIVAWGLAKRDPA